jgi:hypothetical protein
MATRKQIMSGAAPKRGSNSSSTGQVGKRRSDAARFSYRNQLKFQQLIEIEYLPLFKQAINTYLYVKEEESKRVLNVGFEPKQEDTLDQSTTPWETKRYVMADPSPSTQRIQRCWQYIIRVQNHTDAHSDHSRVKCSQNVELILLKSVYSALPTGARTGNNV